MIKMENAEQDMRGSGSDVTPDGNEQMKLCRLSNQDRVAVQQLQETQRRVWPQPVAVPVSSYDMDKSIVTLQIARTVVSVPKRLC